MGESEDGGEDEAADHGGQDQRPERPDHQRVLVQREHRRHRREREQPPAAEVDDPEHRRQADGRDHHAGDQGTHRPPKRRLRLA